jgi:hypothetical protein
MMTGIAEKTNTEPVFESSLRLAHIARAKAEYKMGKAKKALEKGTISEKEYDKQIDMMQSGLEKTPTTGRYSFK